MRREESFRTAGWIYPLGETTCFYVPILVIAGETAVPRIIIVTVSFEMRREESFRTAGWIYPLGETTCFYVPILVIAGETAVPRIIIVTVSVPNVPGNSAAGARPLQIPLPARMACCCTSRYRSFRAKDSGV